MAVVTTYYGIYMVLGLRIVDQYAELALASGEMSDMAGVRRRHCLLL